MIIFFRNSKHAHIKQMHKNRKINYRLNHKRDYLLVVQLPQALNRLIRLFADIAVTGRVARRRGGEKPGADGPGLRHYTICSG